MRVVLQNLWGIRGDWEARRQVLATGLRELAPDLVAFVEAIKPDEYDQAADLLGPEYQLFHAATRHGNGDGAVIASRWELGERHEVDLHVTPRTADFTCTAIIAEVLAKHYAATAGLPPAPEEPEELPEDLVETPAPRKRGKAAAE